MNRWRNLEKTHFLVLVGIWCITSPDHIFSPCGIWICLVVGMTTIIQLLDSYGRSPARLWIYRLYAIYSFLWIHSGTHKPPKWLPWHRSVVLTVIVSTKQLCITIGKTNQTCYNDPKQFIFYGIRVNSTPLMFYLTER